MASVAALYRIPDEAQSAKQRPYSLDELKRLVYYSGAPHSVRAGTLAALEARGAWPRGDGPATTIICVSLMGMMVDGGCCRSTAQRRVKRALKDGFWRETRGANSWKDCPKCGAKRKVGSCAKCPYKGDPKNFDEFRRPFTYELDVQKFLAHPRCRQIHSVDWRTYQEYKAAAEVGAYPNVTEFPRKPAQPSAPTAPLPPAPAVPLPERKTAAEHQHRSVGRTVRTEGRHTYRQTKAFKDRIEYHVEGCHGSVKTRDGTSIFVSADCNPELYRAPLNRALAFKRTLEEFGWTVESAVEAMKFHGFTIEPKAERGP